MSLLINLNTAQSRGGKTIPVIVPVISWMVVNVSISNTQLNIQAKYLKQKLETLKFERSYQIAIAKEKPKSTFFLLFISMPSSNQKTSSSTSFHHYMIIFIRWKFRRILSGIWIISDNMYIYLWIQLHGPKNCMNVFFHFLFLINLHVLGVIIDMNQNWFFHEQIIM